MGVRGRAALATVIILGAMMLAACGSSSKPSPSPSPDSVASATNIASPFAPSATSTSRAPLTASGTPISSGTTSVPATVVYRGNAARRMVALTFDAGAGPGFTAEILDVLQRENVRATFGVTGLWAEQNRDLLNAIAAQGHAFINHTYDHQSFTGLSTGKAPLTAAQRSLELSRTEVTVYHLSGRTTRPYFRPPYGDLDASVQAGAAAGGYTKIIMWTVDTLGWDHASPDAIVRRSLDQAAPGAIYVMHVGEQSQDAAALPRVIDGLRARGYAFGTIDDVLAP